MVLRESTFPGNAGIGEQKSYKIRFGECFWEKMMSGSAGRRRKRMHKKNYKGRCQKKTVSKCKEVAKAYSDI